VTATETTQRAGRVLQNGGVIICPTDAIPGLSCLADQEFAIQEILSIKQRPADMGLILLADQLALFTPFIQPLSPAQSAAIENTNKPTTWLVPPRDSVSRLITGKHPTLAIRICDHEVVQQLCEATQQVLISTSANVHGQKTVTCNADLTPEVRERVDMILPDAPGTGQASIIKHLDNDKVVRS